MTRTQNTKHKTSYCKDIKAEFFPTYGNKKTGGKSDGFMSIGYYPSNEIIRFKNGQMVSDMIGTCGGVNCEGCKGPCYVMPMIKRFIDAREHRIANTLQLRQDINGHFEDIRKCILKDNIKVVRYTESGEIETYLQFIKLVNLALSLPSVRFYLYTKNYTVLRDFFGSGKELPINLVCLISIWEDLGEKEFAEFRNHRNIKAFAVKPATVKPQVMCPAYKKDPKTGRVKLNAEMTCAKCGLCIGTRGNADIIGCLEH